MQPQMQQPDFNQLVAIPTGRDLAEDATPDATVADEKLRQLYVQGGVIPQHIARIVAGNAESEVVQQDAFVSGARQTFIMVPAVLLDPNLRNTSVTQYLAPAARESIELHHAAMDMKRKADDLERQRQKAAANG